MCLVLMGFEELCYSVPLPQQNSVWDTMWPVAPPPVIKMTYRTMYTNILTLPV